VISMELFCWITEAISSSLFPRLRRDSISSHSRVCHRFSLSFGVSSIRRGTNRPAINFYARINLLRTITFHSTHRRRTCSRHRVIVHNHGLPLHRTVVFIKGAVRRFPMLGPGQIFPVCHSSIAMFGREASSAKTSWKLFFFLETTLGPIGAVELAYLKELGAEFTARNIRSFGVAADPTFLEHYRQQCSEENMRLPVEILDDSGGDLSRAVGIRMPQRASFLVDSANVIRYACSYDAAYPRNVFSILSVFDSIHVGQVHPALRGLSPLYGSKPC